MDCKQILEGLSTEITFDEAHPRDMNSYLLDSQRVVGADILNKLDPDDLGFLLTSNEDLLTDGITILSPAQWITIIGRSPSALKYCDYSRWNHHDLMVLIRIASSVLGKIDQSIFDSDLLVQIIRFNREATLHRVDLDRISFRGWVELAITKHPDGYCVHGTVQSELFDHYATEFAKVCDTAYLREFVLDEKGTEPIVSIEDLVFTQLDLMTPIQRYAWLSRRSSMRNYVQMYIKWLSAEKAK